MGTRTKRITRIIQASEFARELIAHGKDCDAVEWTLRTSNEDRDLWLTTPFSVNGRGGEPWEESNYRIINADLEQHAGMDIDYRVDLWPGGHIKTLLVRADDALAIRRVEHWVNHLMNNPLADEDDYYREEWEQNHPSPRECYADEECGCEFRTHACVEHIERLWPDDLKGETLSGHEANCAICGEDFDPFADKYAEFWHGVIAYFGQTSLD
jgi:hypothetical protein